MADAREQETKGAWIVHHGQKIALDINGAAEFPAIDEAAKAAGLLSRLGQTDETVLSVDQVRAVAVAAGLNPRHELNGLLQVLERKRLIDSSANGQEIALLGITTRAALQHAAELFEDADPSVQEEAVIEIAEQVSKKPATKLEVERLVGEQFEITRSDAKDLLGRAEELGFVDGEGAGEDRLIFNGNLFRREGVAKAVKVFASLTQAEHQHVQEVKALLDAHGCLDWSRVETILGKATLDKLVAAGFYDLNVVGNESGEHVFVTLPSAFHKFVDPMIDDCFDMAKALVAALTYGMTKRSSSSGRIVALDRLLGTLISGREIGSATAIGQDYRVLEVNRVVALRTDPQDSRRFYMRLLKREVGELALQVIRTGSAAAESLSFVPAAPMRKYTGPEATRTVHRRRQSTPSKKSTRDVLEALRGGRR